jgi:hypothetical protein
MGTKSPLVGLPSRTHGVCRACYGLVLKPDFADERENELRRQLLAHRGYRLNAVLFHGYPDGAVEWHRERKSIEELRRAK